MKIGDLIQYIPAWQPTCVGVVIGTEEILGEVNRLYIYWSNGELPTWDFARYFEKVINENR
jgi:hypothetical protein